MRKNRSLIIFFVIMSLQTVASNMVHPVTPTFLSILKMPDYMFGFAYAAMSLAYFIFSPFWGRFGDKKGRIPALAITTIGYSITQFLFLYSDSIMDIMIARFLGGLFSGGCLVNFMAYVADCTDEKEQGKYMSIYAALFAASSSLGYLAGGIVGNYGYQFAFYGQIILLFIMGISYKVFLKEGRYYEQRIKESNKKSTVSGNSISSVLKHPYMVIFLFVVFLSCSASTGYDNAFNYYIKDQFSFPPEYNGYIYATVGIIGLVMNMTVNVWLQKNTDCHKTLTVLLGGCSITLFLSIAIKQVVPFIGMNIFFYVFNAMYLPMEQVMVLKQKNLSAGMLSGVFNSVRAVGMVIGSLMAGILYTFGPLLPLVCTASIFFASMVFAWLLYLVYKKGKMNGKQI